MLIRKSLAAVSVVALVAGAPSMAFSADASSIGQSQIFKTGKGAAAGQSNNSSGSSSSSSGGASGGATSSRLGRAGFAH